MENDDKLQNKKLRTLNSIDFRNITSDSMVSSSTSTLTSMLPSSALIEPRISTKEENHFNNERTHNFICSGEKSMKIISNNNNNNNNNNLSNDNDDNYGNDEAQKETIVNEAVIEPKIFQLPKHFASNSNNSGKSSDLLEASVITTSTVSNSNTFTNFDLDHINKISRLRCVDEIDSKKLNEPPIQNSNYLSEQPETLDSNYNLKEYLLEDTSNYIKKGWLLLQQENSSDQKQWQKYWFLLSKKNLNGYKDQEAELLGNIIYNIELNTISTVTEVVDCDRNYSFQISLYNETKYTLSSLTSGIRSTWMKCIENLIENNISIKSCNRLDTKDITQPVLNLDFSTKMDLDVNFDLLSPKSTNSMQFSSNNSNTTATSKSNLFSSDDEYKTASEGCGRRESENWTDTTIHLPPSPLLNRTALSKIKDRDRHRINLKAYLSNNNNNCSNSTNSSRYSTQDSIRTDDSMQFQHDELSSVISSSCNSIDIGLNSSKDVQTKWHSLFQKQQYEIELLNRKLKTVYQQKKQFEEQKIQWDKRENILRDFVKIIQDFFHFDYNDTDGIYLDTTTNCCSAIINQIKTCFEIFKKLYLKQKKEISELKEIIRNLDINDSHVNNNNNNNNISMDQRLKKSLNRVDSITDLSHINLEEIDVNNQEQLLQHYEDLRQRFDKAISEIRLIKKELRESYKSFDNLELKNFSLNQDLKNLDNNYKSQINLMAERIQDLTRKLSTAEKQNRVFKSKVHHTKDKFRSLSLITNTESFLVQKEIEEKIISLENKINSFEEEQQRQFFNKSTSRSVLTSTKDSLQLIIKLNSLDRKLSNIINNSNCSTNSHLDEIEDLLKCALKDDFEMFQEKLHKFRNCFQMKIDKIKPSLTTFNTIVKKLTCEKLHFDYFLIALNSFFNKKITLANRYQFLDKMQICYNEFLSDFKDCMPHDEYQLFLITTFLSQDILIHFDKIVLDIRAFEHTFNDHFLKPNMLCNSRKHFIENLKEVDESLLRILKAIENQNQLHKINLENNKNDYEQKLNVIQKRHEDQLRNLEINFENKRTVFRRIAEKEYEILSNKNHELQMEIEKLNSELKEFKKNYLPLNFKNSNMNYSFEDDNIRQKYQSEIEQLKMLCEKGILAMESSHKRILNEMEDKHRQERKQLIKEKEQALAEETQATLAALEAMRKAHELEVQREIQKFKDDYVRNMKNSHDIGELRKQHETELKEIKQEILSLSEKYSMKCIECATLEQKLKYVTNHLNQGHQKLLQLDTGQQKKRQYRHVLDATKSLFEQSSDDCKSITKAEFLLTKKSSQMDSKILRAK